MTMKSSVVRSFVLFLLLSWSSSEAYKPVIIVHGLFEGAKEMRTITEFIQEAHPGTEVTVLDLFDGGASLEPLWYQVKYFRLAVESIMNRTEDGAHLLCYSQGGVICRALLSVMPKHNIHSFIALSSPLAGQYGGTEYLKKIFPDTLKKEVYKLCYIKLGQELSICQYWNDPHHRHQYLKHSNFLALINGEKEHTFTKVWRENFLRIKKLVLIGGPDDGVITPWQSSLFGFFSSNETVVEMRNQQFYMNDAFGLKTLDLRGDVSVCKQPGVHHTNFSRSVSVFNNCIRDWLT
uniref:palmitoyl-CoA hydrolase n=1 Tax=Neogobius melanostomus TaxID=47308 RepID=A0A8C6SD82_9GOBI